jgi:hypothetical protein
MFFMEVEGSSSGLPDPASARVALPLMSPSRDGREARGRRSGANLQHPAAFRGGRPAMAVTGLTLHDIVNPRAIPFADLFQ